MDNTPTTNISESCSVCKSFISGLHSLFADKENTREFRWTFHDRLPSLSNLAAAARGGCPWCELLDRTVNPLRDGLSNNPPEQEDTEKVLKVYARQYRDPVDDSHNDGPLGYNRVLEIDRNHASFFGSGPAQARSIRVLGSDDFNPFSPAHLRNLRRALGTCVHDHQACPDAVQNIGPTRLLNVMPGDKVRLEYTRGRAVKYAALSYCWGGHLASSSPVHEYRTLRWNVDAREQDGFQLEELPKTLKDAVLITRRLEIPYLWIDALCIIQDDTADWEAESTQMMHYYGNAYITIVPVESDSMYTGIRNDPKDRPFFRTFPGPWNHGGTGSNLVLADAGSRYYDGTLFDSAWSQRGWTYQEMLISARILFVFSYNVTLVCRTVEWDNLQGLHKSQVLPMRFLPIKVREGDESWWYSEDNLHRLWSEFIYDFTRRRLTEPKDRWVAFSGIAQRFSDISGERIIGGLLETRLAEELVSWLPAPSPPVLEPSVNSGDEASFPSWTWLSADWPTKETGIRAHITTVGSFAEHPRARILSILNENDIRSTKLEVRGSIVDREGILGLLCPQDKRTRPLPGRGVAKVRFDDCRCPVNQHPKRPGEICQLNSYAVINSLGPTQVSALFLGIGRCKFFRGAHPDWFFLIVRPTTQDGTETYEEYRRIGTMAIEDDEMQSVARVGIKDQLMSGEKIRTIVLV